MNLKTELWIEISSDNLQVHDGVHALAVNEALQLQLGHLEVIGDHLTCFSDEDTGDYITDVTHYIPMNSLIESLTD